MEHNPLSSKLEQSRTGGIYKVEDVQHLTLKNYYGSNPTNKKRDGK